MTSCSHVRHMSSVILLACEAGVYFAYSYMATARDNRLPQQSIVPVSQIPAFLIFESMNIKAKAPHPLRINRNTLNFIAIRLQVEFPKRSSYCEFAPRAL